MAHRCLASTLRQSACVLLQLFLWISVWVSAGTQAFGGELYAGNPKLAGTDYESSYYGLYQTPHTVHCPHRVHLPSVCKHC